MSVVSVKERWQGRPGDILPLHETTLEREWLVTVDSKTDTAQTIYNSEAGTTLPVYGTAHPDNVYAVCRRLSFTPEPESWKFWIARAFYDRKPLDENEQDSVDNPNPLDRRTQITIRSINREKYITKAYFLSPATGTYESTRSLMTNSAGDALAPWPVDQMDYLVTLQKNVSTAPTWITSLGNTLNNANYTVRWLTIPQGRGRLGGITISDELTENGVTFYSVTGEVEVRDTWAIDRVDEGFHFLDGAVADGNGEYTPGTGVYSAITIPDPDDDSGERRVRPSEPVLLDGAGGILDVASADSPVDRTYIHHEFVSWASLPF